ncbi:MAG: hypothetical protein AAGB51_10410 [Planctomycetota bacterium]
MEATIAGPGPASGAARALLELSDLRRHQRRDVIERVLEAAHALPEPDRELLQAVLQEGTPVNRLARLRGVSVRVTRREVTNLIQRVLSPVYGFVVQQRAGWPRRRARVAELTVVRGMSLRAAAEQLGETVWTVRREREAIGALLEGAQAAARSIHNASKASA